MFVVQIRPGISRHDNWKSSAKEIVNAQNLLVFDVRATISTCICTIQLLLVAYDGFEYILKYRAVEIRLFSEMFKYFFLLNRFDCADQPTFRSLVRIFQLNLRNIKFIIIILKKKLGHCFNKRKCTRSWYRFNNLNLNSISPTLAISLRVQSKHNYLHT